LTDSKDDKEFDPYRINFFEIGKKSVYDYGKHSRPFPARNFERMALFKNVLDGLHACHSLGFIHGDVHVENIVFFQSDTSPAGIYKLIDFGSAVDIGKPAVTYTIEFSAPEVVRGLKTSHVPVADPSMDIFSLGQVILWMSSPIDVLGNDTTPEQKITLLLNDQELDISAIKAKLENNQLVELAERMIKKEAKNRPNHQEIEASPVGRAIVTTPQKTTLSNKENTDGEADPQSVMMHE